MSDTIRILGKDWLDLSVPAVGIEDDTPVTLTLASKNAHGEADTSYPTCVVGLTVTDEAGAALPFTINNLPATTASMVSGAATFTDVRVTIGTAKNVKFTVQTVETTAVIKGAGWEDHDYRPAGYATRLAGAVTPPALAASYDITASGVVDCVGGGYGSPYLTSGFNVGTRTVTREDPVNSLETTGYGGACLPSGVASIEVQYEETEWPAHASMGSHAGASLCKDQSGYWWVRYGYYVWGSYGSSSMVVLNFKSSATASTPVGLTYNYHSLTKDPWNAGSPTNTGAGSVTVSATP